MEMARYKFKGYTITNCGYHQPDHCVWWEAVNENGEACFHGNTLREVEFEILDYEWEQKIRRKDEEIERLKTMPVGNAAAMREALELALDALISWLNGTIDRTTNRETIKAIRAALAAPARQCDVGTPEEQEKRYKLKREVYHTLTLTNALAWEQTPYEAQEGGAE
jgi:hypothetical protein